jgi:hypothetical protein
MTCRWGFINLKPGHVALCFNYVAGLFILFAQLRVIPNNPHL